MMMTYLSRLTTTIISLNFVDIFLRFLDGLTSALEKLSEIAPRIF